MPKKIKKAKLTATATPPPTPADPPEPPATIDAGNVDTPPPAAPKAIADEKYVLADDDVIQIANDLIEKHHPHLKGARMSFLFDMGESPKMKGGKAEIASVRLATGLLRLYAESDFIIVIHGETWTDKLNELQRNALLDHELCHCKKNDGSWALVGHELEEFGAIVQRWGFWRLDVQKFAKSVQMELDLTGGEIKPR